MAFTNEVNQEFEDRLAAYIAEVSRPGIPYISTSHITLRNLYADFGAAYVDYRLSVHWKN